MHPRTFLVLALGVALAFAFAAFVAAWTRGLVVSYFTRLQASNPMTYDLLARSPGGGFLGYLLGGCCSFLGHSLLGRWLGWHCLGFWHNLLNRSSWLSILHYIHLQ